MTFFGLTVATAKVAVFPSILKMSDRNKRSRNKGKRRRKNSPSSSPEDDAKRSTEGFHSQTSRSPSLTSDSTVSVDTTPAQATRSKVTLDDVTGIDPRDEMKGFRKSTNALDNTGDVPNFRSPAGGSRHIGTT